jgi:hypothetical protein
MLGILLVAGMSASAQNLLNNGGFEASVPDGTKPGPPWRHDWSPIESGSVTTNFCSKNRRLRIMDVYCQIGKQFLYYNISGSNMLAFYKIQS